MLFVKPFQLYKYNFTLRLFGSNCTALWTNCRVRTNCRDFLMFWSYVEDLFSTYALPSSIVVIVLVVFAIANQFSTFLSFVMSLSFSVFVFSTLTLPPSFRCCHCLFVAFPDGVIIFSTFMHCCHCCVVIFLLLRISIHLFHFYRPSSRTRRHI